MKHWKHHLHQATTATLCLAAGDLLAHAHESNPLEDEGGREGGRCEGGREDKDSTVMNKKGSKLSAS